MHDRAITPDTDIRVDAADESRAIEVFRCDRIGVELLQSRMRADGSWLLQGIAAKAGILEYTRPDGTVCRELVPPEELSDAESLATLARASVTLEHPIPLGTMVDPSNVQAHGVGDVGGDELAPAVTWDAEGARVIVSTCVRRADAISAIRGGKVELSAGYRMTIDVTPGTHPIYGPYDAVQRKRRYNHVAITDTGRAGHDVRLRTDSAGNQVSPIEVRMNPTLLALAALLGIKRLDADDAILAEAPAAIAALKAEAPPEMASVHADLEAKIKALTEQLAQAIADLNAAKAGAGAGAIVDMIGAAMEATPVAAEALPTATPEQKFDSSIRAVVRARGADRLRMERVAEGLRVDAAEVAKLGDGALCKLLVTTANPEAPAAESAVYYRARFDAMTEGQRLDSADASPYAAMSAGASARLEAARLGADVGSRTDGADKPRVKPSAASLASMRGLTAKAAE